MTILLTGGNGKLGREIRGIFPECLSPSHNELDITDTKSVLNFVREKNVDKIIHTAALTSIRLCEDKMKEAWKTNVEGTRNLVQSLHECNPSGYFLDVSTACVFMGDEEMYSEESIPYPINFYGLTKLLGELIVQTLSNHLIVRTNFVGKKPWPYKKAFTDRFGTYLFAEDVAKAIKELFHSNVNGLVHVVGDKIMSMYELAKLTTPNIQPMTIGDYSGPHLTINMTLDTKRLKKYKISEV